MARCQCNKQCSCFIIDDGYEFATLEVPKNNDTTYVEGVGLETQPYVIHNIHDPNFIPPTAHVTYSGATFSTDFPAGSGGGGVPFDQVDWNPYNMFSLNKPDRITILHDGLYMIGFQVAMAVNNSGAPVSSFAYSGRIDCLNPDGTISAIYEERNFFEVTTISNLVPTRSQLILSPNIFHAGEAIKLFIDWDVRLLGLTAAMWIGYC